MLTLSGNKSWHSLLSLNGNLMSGSQNLWPSQMALLKKVELTVTKLHHPHSYKFCTWGVWCLGMPAVVIVTTYVLWNPGFSAYWTGGLVTGQHDLPPAEGFCFCCSCFQSSISQNTYTPIFESVKIIPAWWLISHSCIFTLQDNCTYTSQWL